MVGNDSQRCRAGGPRLGGGSRVRSAYVQSSDCRTAAVAGLTVGAPPGDVGRPVGSLGDPGRSSRVSHARSLRTDRRRSANGHRHSSRRSCSRARRYPGNYRCRFRALSSPAYGESTRLTARTTKRVGGRGLQCVLHDPVNLHRDRRHRPRIAIQLKAFQKTTYETFPRLAPTLQY